MSEHTQSTASTGRGGQMTAVMRAVGSSGPKALRLGLLKDGRVVDEKVLKQRQAVSVGSSEKNVFVVTAEGLPSRFVLFDVEDGRYVLQFNDSMSGRVAMPSGIMELSELKSQAEDVDGIYRVHLPEDVRGKLQIGDSAFLFQFVATPPAQPRPQLPVSVTRGAVGVDWTTTVIAALSFFIHFTLISMAYHDWLDPVIDYDVNVANIVEAVKNMPPPPEVEQKNVEDDKKDEKKPEEQPEKKVQKSAPTKTTPGPKQKMSAAQVAALSEELDKLDLGILGANLGNTATANVLSNSDSISTDVMDQAAASGAGVSAGGPGLKLSAGGGAIRPGESGGSLASIGAKGKTGGDGSGNVKKVAGPKGNASVGSASVAGGAVSNASRVVARMRAGFRACYNRGLNENPDISGRINLVLRIGPGGEVTSVSASKTGNLPASVVACVKARAQSGRFSPPEGGASAVSVPVNFVAQ